jgi:hypothetical protein
MFESLFDLPLLIGGPVIIATLCLFAVAGLLLVRRKLLPRLRVETGDSEFTGAMLQSVMVFYGLAVALIAVSVWQTYSDTSKLASQEAAALAILYRDVDLYPEPQRTELQQGIREHLNHIINDDWPLQKKGKLPGVRAEAVSRMRRTLMSFEPATEAQKLQHGETLHALNEAINATRLRVDSIGTGLPGVLWLIVVAGAFISLSASFFFKVEDVRLHIIEVVLLAVFIGLVIFMILALDRPFRGDLGIRSDPYQLVYDQLMKTNP